MRPFHRQPPVHELMGHHHFLCSHGNDHHHPLSHLDSLSRCSQRDFGLHCPRSYRCAFSFRSSSSIADLFIQSGRPSQRRRRSKRARVRLVPLPARRLQLTFLCFAATEIVRSTETATIELPAVTEVVQLAALTGQLSAAPKLLNDGADAFSSQRPHGDPDPSSGHSYCDVDRSACTSHR